MTDEPFGRQPEPVTITLSGHPLDVEYYKSILMRLVRQRSYDNTMDIAEGAFKILPQAVNE